MTDDYMKLEDAVEIVLNLAKTTAGSHQVVSARPNTAIRVVEDFFVNNLDRITAIHIPDSTWEEDTHVQPTQP